MGSWIYGEITQTEGPGHRSALPSLSLSHSQGGRLYTTRRRARPGSPCPAPLWRRRFCRRSGAASHLAPSAGVSSTASGWPQGWAHEPPRTGSGRAPPLAHLRPRHQQQPPRTARREQQCESQVREGKCEQEGKVGLEQCPHRDETGTGAKGCRAPAAHGTASASHGGGTWSGSTIPLPRKLAIGDCSSFKCGATRSSLACCSAATRPSAVGPRPVSSASPASGARSRCGEP
mmetsp:Transcript_133473/g.372135  ORF Transcript_133473/g.372135 Transcript_133473/m.372135 type:complete len:232 (-) Transcript_133473:921-1616(-)